MKHVLRIASLGVFIPPSADHTNLLGTTLHTGYRQLLDAAGSRSRPPTVRRGGTLILGERYSAPTAAAEKERSSELASRAVGDVLTAEPSTAPHVRSILHAQCSLDQQVLGSACLRVEHDHFRHAKRAMSIGQLGTAGVPTVFQLAAMDTRAGHLACVSASDKWIAPFFRRVPGLATYADASAASIVAANGLVAAPIAEVEDLVASCRPPGHDLWTAPAPQQLEHVRAHAEQCIHQLLSRHPDVERAALSLAGDTFEQDLNTRLAEASGIGGVLEAPVPGIHLSSASPLVALRSAIAQAVKAGTSRRVVIWTASPAGHAGAMLVRCAPDAVATPTGWTSRLSFPSTADHGGVAHAGQAISGSVS
ncbi:hypothetical protein LZ198_28800 [Myxococcus sp. K15C18031901]|uniref:hypothetical protein n=1 Tax=Myxococcus dinghuensis TaxID=2906761 RepID=UPI0020A7B5A3|nr:hypothetical protein [Myxococcus dinghuensis]MCP3102883.1 hypothetical protein [Myxococcus dinghuensis]